MAVEISRHTKQISPRTLAAALGVSEASVKRWCDRGMIPCIRTAGGHRRIDPCEVIRFVREHGHEVTRPELLGLPATGAGREVTGTPAGARAALANALSRGDEIGVTRLVTDLFIRGASIVEICDFTIAGAYRILGERWSSGHLKIYEERRACEMTERALFTLRALLPEAGRGAPVAIGGTAAGDPYTLVNSMVELTLREVGWHAESIGTGIPLSEFVRAIEDRGPRLVWLGAAAIADTETFVAGYDEVFEAASRAGAAVVIGGRAMTSEIRARLRFSCHCDRLEQLAAFARAVVGG